jgi:hypothetical protein
MATLRDFRPTSEQINALPKGIRMYVHDLETLCDPAGMVAENILIKDMNKMLSATNAKLNAELAKDKP